MNRFQAGFFLASFVGSLAIISAIAQTPVRFQDKDLISTQLSQATGKVFPLSQVGTCEQSDRIPASNNTIISVKGATLEIRGTDSFGVPWSAKLSIYGPSCTILEGDLDNNGQPDLVIYAPGIDDRGAYGTTLSLLLFDKNGKPFPWQATGRFTLVEGGIQQIRKDAKGALLFQTAETGLPAWGGISLISYLYRFQDSRVVATNDTLGGIKFPHVISQNPSDVKTTRVVNSIQLSTDIVPPGTTSPVQSADSRFVRYGTTSNAPVASANSTPESAGQGVNPVIDMTALSGSEKRITMSDGSRIDLPDILVMDDAKGIRQIVFHPEEADFQPMHTGKYRLHPTGLNCSGPDDCKPFIVWAK